MNEDKKSYMLVEYAGTRDVTVFTDKKGLAKDKAKALLKEVSNYNKRKSSEYLLGNIKVLEFEDRCILTGHIYKKYENRMTIGELDKLTSFYDEDSLIEKYKDKRVTNDVNKPDINVAYLRTEPKDENGNVEYKNGIRYLPVLYAEDTEYLDKKYVLNSLYFHASTRDFDFFRSLANKFCVHHFVLDEIEKLRIATDKCENQNYDLNILFNAACKLYDKVILKVENDESLSRDEKGRYIISDRRLRDFGFFIKNYNIRDSKIKSPLCYNYPVKPKYIEEETGQIKLVLK